MKNLTLTFTICTRQFLTILLGSFFPTDSNKSLWQKLPSEPATHKAGAVTGCVLVQQGTT